MKYWVLIVCLVVSTQLLAQTHEDCAPEEGPIYKLVEDMPHPTGCLGTSHDALCLKSTVQSFMSVHPDYQQMTTHEEQSGSSVHLTYTVGSNGCISNVLVRRESKKGLGTAIGQILRQMPKWKPGKTLGQPVRVRQHITIEVSNEDALVKK